MNNEIRSISNKMHERGLSSDKQEFGSFYLLRFLGAKINFEPNQCIVSLESVPPMFNPQGTLHGGIITTIMDISMGHLIKNEQSAGTTLELKVNFMSAIKHEKIKCVGSFLKKGRKASQAGRRQGFIDWSYSNGGWFWLLGWKLGWKIV